MVLKTTFGQSQRWSPTRCTLGVENEGKNNLNFANKVFNRQDVLILVGLNSGISLYIKKDNFVTILNFFDLFSTSSQRTMHVSLRNHIT